MQIAQVGDEVVRHNVRYFWLRHLWRKALPFLHRTMTLGMVLGDYDLLSGFPSMNMSVRGLTEGLRRSYLVDDTSFKRNSTGPWQTVSAFSTFGQQISEWCSGRALRMPVLDLFKAYQDMVRAFLFVPITFTAKISSLHSWLFTNVLDVSSMAIMTYMMYITGLRAHCPLHVLALVARCHTLNKQQEQQYDALCSSIAHLVIHWAFETPIICEQRAISGIRNTKCGVMSEVDTESMVRWCNWENNDEGLVSARQKRNEKNDISTFVAPTMQFVYRERADFAKFVSYRQEMLNEFTAKTPQLFLAHSFALQQTERAHNDRVMRAQSLLPYHMPHEFWEAMHKGTRLPRPDSENCRMDRYELDFQPVWETGYWYQQTMDRMKSCRGVMKHFLVLCGMNESTSVRDFAIKIFGPYFKKKIGEEGLANLKFHDNKEWNQPIMNSKDMFKWGAQPRVARQKAMGMEVILGMNLPHYIVAQGLVCKGWSHENDGYTVIAHLRNMAYMSQELLSLFIHTRIEKAAISANDGCIIMPQRSPDGLGKPASLVFDERLHMDSVDSVDNMLCMRARQSSGWDLVQNGQRTFLIYKPVSELRDSKGVTDEIFPFPPESVMHMQTHFMMMKRTLTALQKQVEKEYTG